MVSGRTGSCRGVAGGSGNRCLRWPMVARSAHHLHGFGRRTLCNFMWRTDFAHTHCNRNRRAAYNLQLSGSEAVGTCVAHLLWWCSCPSRLRWLVSDLRLAVSIVVDWRPDLVWFWCFERLFECRSDYRIMTKLFLPGWVLPWDIMLRWNIMLSKMIWLVYICAFGTSIPTAFIMCFNTCWCRPFVFEYLEIHRVVRGALTRGGSAPIASLRLHCVSTSREVAHELTGSVCNSIWRFRSAAQMITTTRLMLLALYNGYVMATVRYPISGCPWLSSSGACTSAKLVKDALRNKTCRNFNEDDQIFLIK